MLSFRNANSIVAIRFHVNCTPENLFQCTKIFFPIDCCMLTEKNISIFIHSSLQHHYIIWKMGINRFFCSVDFSLRMSPTPVSSPAFVVFHSRHCNQTVLWLLWWMAICWSAQLLQHAQFLKSKVFFIFLKMCFATEIFLTAFSIIN